MFFDDQNITEDFAAGMIEIARLQKELLGLRYDRAKRQPIPLAVKKKGLFGREQLLPPSYMAKLELLKEKQRLLSRERSLCGYQDGMVWWKLDWERVVPVLLHELTFPEEEENPDENGFRRGFSFQRAEGREDCQLFYLRMQEHSQKTSFSRDTVDIEHSAYTRAEREAMVDAYNEKKNRSALRHIVFANSVGVYSVDTGFHYDTAADYYTSAEYISDRLRQSEKYSQSLYTVEERHTLYVGSQSKNRVSMHGICEFHVDAAGTLDRMVVLDFEELSASDSGGAASGAFFDRKDAAVTGAFLLAELNDVKRVPMSLFEKACNPDNYWDVTRMAGIMTCLAYKLTAD